MKKIIVLIYTVIMTVITFIVTPVKAYVMLDSSYIHIKNSFRSILLPSFEAAADSKGIYRYDLNFPVLIVLWVITTILAASAFYLLRAKNTPDH